MRVLLSIVAAGLLLCTAMSAQELPNSKPPAAGCAASASPDCGPTKAGLKKAAREFDRAQKLRKSDPEAALEAVSAALALDPRNLEYATAREVLRQQLVYAHIQQGNLYASAQRTADAVAEFRHALELDPANEYAAQQLRSSANAPLPPAPTWLESGGDDDLTLHPKPGRQNFHFMGDTRAAYTNVATAFGIKVTLDESVPLRQFRVDMDKASFEQAMDAVAAMTRTFWTPVSSTEALVAADTPAKHKELDRMMLRTFYLPEAGTVQELNDIVNLLRTIFEIRFVTISPANSTISVRAPAPIMHAATRFLESLAAGRPQVMLDIEVFAINRQMLESIGVQLPLQYQVFQIGAAALAALGGNSNAQQLINQLIASGGINQANFSSVSALLSQLQNQQNSPFSQPVATFGGGETLSGIQIPPATANFSRNESRLYTLQKVSLRAAQGDSATMRIGQRYPVINASFSPVYNNPQVGAIVANNTYVAPIPSFNYEDLGVTLKAKPLVHGTEDVTLDLELEIKALTGQSFNGVPVIGNRSYKGTITLPNHEAAVVTGSISVNDQQTTTGPAGFPQVPLLSTALTNRNPEHDEAELLIIITPHIVRAAATGSSLTIPVPRQ